MNAYTGFAEVYNIFMDNVPYEDWADYVVGLLKEYGILEGLILDLGCGTGNITRPLSARGYDMIGIDYSEEMLGIAREYEYKCEGNSKEQDKKQILYLMQDMRSFELYGTVSGIVSICDSMNYITSEKELLSVFQLVNNYLDPGGIFIFDMNTEYKYKHLLGDNTIAENRENCSFIWENHYDEETAINEYDLTIFVKISEDTDGIEEIEEDLIESESIQYKECVPEEWEDMEEETIFQRFHEMHYQKSYSISCIKELINKSGLEFLAVYDAFTHEAPNHTSERIYFVVREQFQKNKVYK